MLLEAEPLHHTSCPSGSKTLNHRNRVLNLGGDGLDVVKLSCDSGHLAFDFVLHLHACLELLLDLLAVLLQEAHDPGQGLDILLKGVNVCLHFSESGHFGCCCSHFTLNLIKLYEGLVKLGEIHSSDCDRDIVLLPAWVVSPVEGALHLEGGDVALVLGEQVGLAADGLGYLGGVVGVALEEGLHLGLDGFGVHIVEEAVRPDHYDVVLEDLVLGIDGAVWLVGAGAVAQLEGEVEAVLLGLGDEGHFCVLAAFRGLPQNHVARVSNKGGVDLITCFGDGHHNQSAGALLVVVDPCVLNQFLGLGLDFFPVGGGVLANVGAEFTGVEGRVDAALVPAADSVGNR